MRRLRMELHAAIRADAQEKIVVEHPAPVEGGDSERGTCPVFCLSASEQGSRKIHAAGLRFVRPCYASHEREGIPAGAVTADRRDKKEGPDQGRQPPSIRCALRAVVKFSRGLPYL